MKQLDEIDKKIIVALENDAHISSLEISRQIGICAPTIRRRVNRLMHNGIIRIQAMQINRVRESLTVSIQLKVENIAVVRTANLLAVHPEIGFLVLTAGYYNICCLSHFESTEAYSRFLNTVLYPLKDVLEMDTLICTEDRKYSHKKQQVVSGAGKTARKALDPIDMKIMAALEKDAHQNSTTLAKSLNISAATIRRRIKDLLNNNIIHIQAFPNLRIGNTIASIIALKVDGNALNRIADYLAGMHEVRQVLLTTGSFDMGIWVWFDSIEAFSEFLNNVLNPLEGVQKKLILIQTEIKKMGSHLVKPTS
jgi:Lrp/AsnC family transcriptional regulator, regulator for asnA, asnC and gidA